MKIIINGAGFANKGAEAMARTLQTELMQRIPACEFYLWRPALGDCRPALNSGFIPLALPFEKENSFWRRVGQRVSPHVWSFQELCRARDWRVIAAAFASSKRRLASAGSRYLARSGVGFDAFCDISGFAYGDPWGLVPFERIAPLMTYLRASGKPSVFFPQAWGSFEKPHVKQALRGMLGYDRTHFFSRDKRSCRFLETALGKERDSIPVAPDIVFGFSGGAAGRGEHLLESMGCSRERPILGVSPNMRVYERVEGRGMGNGYLRAMAELLDHCLRDHDVDVVLQANEIAPEDNRQDDRYLCSMIAAALDRPDRCFMTREPLSAEASKALIGQFDYIVGSRFHSLVFALSQGVPGLAVGWSHKYRELFALFEMQSSVHEHGQIEGAALIDAFERGWAEREQNRELILSKARHLQSEARSLWDAVADRLLTASCSKRNTTEESG